MPTINDLKKKALNNAGYSGDINVAENKWLTEVCAPYKASTPQMWKYALKQAGYTQNNLIEAQNKMLSDLGHTGALPNKWYKYWNTTPLEGVEGDPILSAFADGTDGFYFDFSKTDRLFQNTTGMTLADDAGENIALALEGSRLDGRGIINLLLRSQEADNGSWVKFKALVTANAVAAPDGTVTADKLIANNTASDVRGMYQGMTVVAATTYTYSFYAKAAEYSNLLLCDLSAARFGASFDLAAGTSAPVGGAGLVSHSITSVGNGWYRCSVVWTSLATGPAIYVMGYPAGATITASGASYTGDGVSGIYVWGGQLEVGTIASAYQPTGATLGGPGNHGSQTTTAAQPKWQTGGLARFDGLDDNLLTTFAPGPSMTIMAKFQGVAPSAANIRIAIGGRDSTNARSYLAINGVGAGSGLLAGVGTGTITAGNIDNTLGVGAVTYDGVTVRLYWNGIEIANAAQVGFPTTTKPFTIGAFNDVSTLGQFWSGDIYHALVIKKALTAAEIAAITNKWGTS